MRHSRHARSTGSRLPNANFRFLLDPFTGEFAATGGGTRTTQEQAASLSQLMVEAALEYASLGLRVIPLLERSKKPRISNWPKEATTASEVIEGWFHEWPGSNLGIAMGNGCLALDVDTRHGGEGSLENLIAEVLSNLVDGVERKGGVPW